MLWVPPMMDVTRQGQETMIYTVLVIFMCRGSMCGQLVLKRAHTHVYHSTIWVWYCFSHQNSCSELPGICVNLRTNKDPALKNKTIPLSDHQLGWTVFIQFTRHFLSSGETTECVSHCLNLEGIEYCVAKGVIACTTCPPRFVSVWRWVLTTTLGSTVDEVVI